MTLSSTTCTYPGQHHSEVTCSSSKFCLWRAHRQTMCNFATSRALPSANNDGGADPRLDGGSQEDTVTCLFDAFFFMTGIPAGIVAAIVSLIADFVVGAAKSLITIRSWWSSGFEMTWIGALEGAVTYAIGIGLGKIGGG
jgi:hypothetical protein